MRKFCPTEVRPALLVAVGKVTFASTDPFILLSLSCMCLLFGFSSVVSFSWLCNIFSPGFFTNELEKKS